MQRNMETVRSMLIDFSQGKGRRRFERNEEDLEYIYHLDILKQAGFISFRHADTFEGRILYEVPQLTWSGNDYLDAISDETVWKKTKEGIKEKGLELTNVPFNLLKDYAIVVLKQKLGIE